MAGALAEVKRRCQVGVQLRIVDHHLLRSSDPARVASAQAMLGVPRTIARVQTNGVWFEPSNPAVDKRRSWLVWPKASWVELTGGGFRLIEPGYGVVIEYEFI